jgi:hypothetical protein
VRRVAAGLVLYLTVSVAFAMQAVLLGSGWILPFACLAAFFGFMGAFGIAALVFSRRVRDAAASEPKRPPWILPLFLACLAVMIGAVAFAVQAHDVRQSLAATAAVITTLAVAVFGRRLAVRRRAVGGDPKESHPSQA